MKRTPRSVNWPALRAEFIGGNESLNAFRLRHDLARDYFYKRAKGWETARGKARENGVKRAALAVEDFYASFARETRDLLRGLLRHAREFLALADGGRTVLPPGELATLARAVAEALKTAHLIEGRPTVAAELTPGKGDLNAALVLLLEELDGPRPSMEGQ